MEWDYEFADFELQMNVAFCHYLLQKENVKYRMLEIFDFQPVFSVQVCQSMIGFQPHTIFFFYSAQII